MSKKKDEVITVKAVVNLNDVIFKPDFESGIYKMTLPTGWGFSIQTEVTEETKKEILEIDYDEVKEEAWDIYQKHYHDDGFGGIFSGTPEEKRRYLREAVEYFKNACNSQRKQQSHDGKFYAITTVDEVGIKEFKKDEIQLQTHYGYFKNQRDCQECIDYFKEQIDQLEID